MSHSRIWGASFDKAVLRRADLSHVTNRNPELSEDDPNAWRSVFSGADLVGADVIDTVLRHTDFSWAVLSRSNFRGTDLDRSVFARADMDNVEGLQEYPPGPPATVGLGMYP